MCDCCDRHHPISSVKRGWYLLAILPAFLLVKLFLHIAYDKSNSPMPLAVCHTPYYAQTVTPEQNPSPYLHPESVTNCNRLIVPCQDDTSTQGVLLGKD